MLMQVRFRVIVHHGNRRRWPRLRGERESATPRRRNTWATLFRVFFTFIPIDARLASVID